VGRKILETATVDKIKDDKFIENLRKNDEYEMIVIFKTFKKNMSQCLKIDDHSIFSYVGDAGYHHPFVVIIGKI